MAEVGPDAGRAARFSVSAQSTGWFGHLPSARCAIYRAGIADNDVPHRPRLRGRGGSMFPEWDGHRRSAARLVVSGQHLVQLVDHTLGRAGLAGSVRRRFGNVSSAAVDPAAKLNWRSKFRIRSPTTIRFSTDQSPSHAASSCGATSASVQAKEVTTQMPALSNMAVES
jgi:hypothetical protein